MNDQLQQIFSLQQALATAAAAAVINNLINPQQQQQQSNPNQNPNSNNNINIGNNNQPQQQIQDVNSQANQLQNLLLQLQQQAALQQQVQAQADLQQFQPQQPLPQLQLPQMTQNIAQINQPNQSPLTGFQGLNNISPSLTSTQSILSALSSVVNNSTSQQVPNQHLNLTHQQQNLNLNLNQHHSLSPNLSPNISHNNSRHNNLNSPTLNHQQASLNNINSSCNKSQTPIKKLKRNHNQQASDATSKPQTTPVIAQSQISKNHSSQPGSPHMQTRNSTTNSSSSPSASFSNLPRKLVRGQDVWLGRGAEQTRQILKCMWCGQSFKTLADMTEHMKLTQHYTNIVSQEQITSWKHPDDSKKSSKSKGIIGLDAKLDCSSDQDDMFSGDDELYEPMSDNQRFNPNSNLSSISDQPEDFTVESNQFGVDLTRNTNPINEALIVPKLKTTPLKSSKRDSDGKSSKQAARILRSTNKSKSEENQNVSNNLNSSMDKSKEIYRENKSTSSNSDNQVAQVNGELDPTNVDDEDIKNVIEQMLNREDSDNSCASLDSDNESRQQNNKKEFISDKSSCDVDTDRVEDDSIESYNVKINNGLESNQRGYDFDKINQSEEASKIVQTQLELGQRNLFTQQSELNTHTKSPQRNPSNGDTSGDPLSALESMVETNVSSSGVGILQRLGIDEEVGPPWQNINYASWCAAAYGNPMAAAFIAAGLNFQNGLRLTKNLRKNED